MAKLDEIAELLTEEIHSFEQTVSKLEVIQKSLKDYKLEPDTSIVNQMLSDYHEKQQHKLRRIEDLIAKVTRSIEKSRLIPDWQIKTFWAWNFINLVGWGLTIMLLLK